MASSQMVANVEVYRTASVLIREHDEDAALEAAQRADSFLDAGDLDGQRIRHECEAIGQCAHVFSTVAAGP